MLEALGFTGEGFQVAGFERLTIKHPGSATFLSHEHEDRTVLS